MQLFIQYTFSYVITKFLLSSTISLKCKVLVVNLSGAVTPSLIRISSLNALVSGGGALKMIGNQKVNSIMIESNHEFSPPVFKVVYNYTMSLFCSS